MGRPSVYCAFSPRYAEMCESHKVVSVTILGLIAAYATGFVTDISWSRILVNRVIFTPRED